MKHSTELAPDTTGMDLHWKVWDENVKLETLLAVAKHPNTLPATLNALTDYKQFLMKYPYSEEVHLMVIETLVAVASHPNASPETIHQLLRAQAYFEHDAYFLHTEFIQRAIRKNPNTWPETLKAVGAEISMVLVQFPISHRDEQCNRGFHVMDAEPLAVLHYTAEKTIGEWMEHYLPDAQWGVSPSCEGRFHTYYEGDQRLEVYISVPLGITIEDAEDYLQQNYTWL